VKKTAVVVVAIFLITLIAGCGGALVKKEAMASVKYAGILSLTVGKTGPHSATNDEVLQQVANYALGQVESRLRTVSSFKLVPVSTLYKVPEFRNAGTFSQAEGVRAYLKKQSETDPNFVAGANMSNSKSAAGAFAALLSGGGAASADEKQKAIDSVCLSGQRDLDAKREDFVVTSGLPFIPYGVINNEDPNVTEVRYVNGVRQGSKTDYLKTMVIEEIKTFCVKSRLDAVIIVLVQTQADPPKGVYVISGGNRVLGTVRLNMTMLMVDKNGEIIADMGWPSMDDLAPLKMVIPASIVTKWSSNGKGVMATQIDLKDPQGSVLNAFKELVVESSEKMTDSLRQELGETK
jgi:hypothetical protein